MASWVEMESFFFRGKQFLDHAWCCLGEKLKFGAHLIPTLSAAMNRMQDKVKDEEGRDYIRKKPYFLALVEAWDKWGQELAGMRNYIEHHATLGGLAFSYGISILGDKQVSKLYLPDEFPKWMDNPPKRTFTYNKKRSASEYLHSRMADIDELTVRLLNIYDPDFLLEYKE